MDPTQPLYEIKANLFKGLAHPARVRVLEILAAGGDVPVQDLIAGTGLEQSHLSQHLAVLRRYQLVTSERQGSQVVYRLVSTHVADLLRVCRELLAEILRTTEQQLRSTLEHAGPAVVGTSVPGSSVPGPPGPSGPPAAEPTAGAPADAPAAR